MGRQTVAVEDVEGVNRHPEPFTLSKICTWSVSSSTIPWNAGHPFGMHESSLGSGTDVEAV